MQHEARRARKSASWRDQNSASDKAEFFKVVEDEHLLGAKFERRFFGGELQDIWHVSERETNWLYKAIKQLLVRRVVRQIDNKDPEHESRSNINKRHFRSPRRRRKDLISCRIPRQNWIELKQVCFWLFILLTIMGSEKSSWIKQCQCRRARSSTSCE
jgi:hypothetical protein